VRFTRCEGVNGVGLYKLCEHKGRNRDRCEHAWWGSFRGVRVSLPKWANREVQSKAEAGALLDELRTEIRSGTFDSRGQRPVEATPMTFCDFADVYKERHVIAKRLALAKGYDWAIKPFIERFGDWALGDIKTADIEDFIAELRKPRVIGRRPGLRTLTPGAVNRIMDLLRHMMNWAVAREYIQRTPFRRGTETLIKKLHDDSRRRRRVSEDEEAALLGAAPPQIRAMLIAAIDTGMRRGEMLALRFGDIDMERGLIVLRGETTKSKKTRLVPISTERLRAVLAWLRLDADGEEKSQETLVFSNEVSEPLRLFHHSWVMTVLKAHGVTPAWSAKLDYKGLSDESQDVFRRINLRWHDLRHEYASRLVEQGVPLAQVRDLLGHASITTTERYDNQKLENLQIAAAKLERGQVFDVPLAGGAEAPPSKIGGTKVPPSVRSRARKPRTLVRRSGLEASREGAKFQESFKFEGADTGSGTPKSVPAIEPNELNDLDLRDWLGGRDSNPDNRVQSAVSYR
jgi:integrase